MIRRTFVQAAAALLASIRVHTDGATPEDMQLAAFKAHADKVMRESERAVLNGGTFDGINRTEYPRWTTTAAELDAVMKQTYGKVSLGLLDAVEPS